MIGRIFAYRLISARKLRALRSEASTATQIAETTARIEKVVIRLQREVERLKLQGAVVLEQRRAIAMLATGQRIYVDPRDQGSAVDLLTTGKYEEDEFRLFRRFLRPGATVLDIGANYGYYSIVSAPYIKPEGRIISFEPNPHIHSLFRSSLYVNGLLDVVETRNVGVYDINSTLAFEINEASPGGAHVLTLTDRPPAHHQVIDVPTVRLDDHLPSDLIVDLVKIDVEAHEGHVLMGMRDVITRSPDIVIFMEFIYSLFSDEEEIVKLGKLVVEDLNLTINKVLPSGSIQEVQFEQLRGQSCSLILSKGRLPVRPDLTIEARQLSLVNGERSPNDSICWSHEQSAGAEQEIVIAHGPYVYLPRGSYRLKIEADIMGDFLIRLQEHIGDRIGPDIQIEEHKKEIDVNIINDAPYFELVILANPMRSTSLTFCRAEFWPQ